MFTATVFLLFALGLGLLFRRPGGARMCLMAALALLWLGGSGYLTARLLGWLQDPHPRLAQPPWGERNAVVLLGAGVVRTGAGESQPSLLAYSRIQEAARLYRACRARGGTCLLVISGGDPEGVGATEAEVYRRALLDLGLPDADLRLETRSRNTFQNAQYSCALLEATSPDRVVLVTSSLHMRRSLCYFNHFRPGCLGSGADHAMARPGWLPHGYNLVMADFAVQEYLGLVRYRIYNALGRNPKRAAAPQIIQEDQAGLKAPWIWVAAH